MLLLEPVDLRGNRRRARIDPPLVGLDDGRGSHGLALWIVKKQDHIVMQPALVPLQGQRVAAFTLLGDGVEPSQNLAANAFIDPAPFGCYRTKGKATADPSTPLRSAQDDSSVVMQSFMAGSIVEENHQ